MNEKSNKKVKTNPMLCHILYPLVKAVYITNKSKKPNDQWIFTGICQNVPICREVPVGVFILFKLFLFSKWVRTIDHSKYYD